MLSAIADAAECGAVEDHVVAALLARWVREAEGQLAELPPRAHMEELSRRLAEDAERLRLLEVARVRTVLAHLLFVRSPDLANRFDDALRIADRESLRNEVMADVYARLGLGEVAPLSKTKAEEVIRASLKVSGSRRATRVRRRRLRELDGLPAGRGQAAKTIARRNEMLTCFTELQPADKPSEVFHTYSADRQFVEEHIERHGVSNGVARTDWRAVKKMLVARGLAPGALTVGLVRRPAATTPQSSASTANTQSVTEGQKKTVS